MNDDAVTWTQVWAVSLTVLAFMVLAKFAKRITALEDGAKERAGAVSGDS